MGKIMMKLPMVCILLLSIINSGFMMCTTSSTTQKFPNARRFLPLPGSYGLEERTNPLLLRVMQFNVLADGLAGVRPDLGGFNRATEEILRWDRRKLKLMHEISQYEPDIVTLQEVDHYYDFFLPEMTRRGYLGFFARKPTSACLEYSKSGCGDGCAMFVKRSKLRVISCEAKTLALSIAGQDSNGELIEDDASLQLQNQVGLIAVCEIITWTPPNEEQNRSAVQRRINADDDNPYSLLHQQYTYQDKPPPIIIASTHLKSSKSATGERYREKGVLQILSDMDKIYQKMSAADRTPAVLLLGDFNAVPDNEESDYPSLTYRAVKSHQLGLRSVYNDDVPLSQETLSDKMLYTTWKARMKAGGKERVIKRCIDYIFYTPYIQGTKRFDPMADSLPTPALSSSTASSLSPLSSSSLTTVGTNIITTSSGDSNGNSNGSNAEENADSPVVAVVYSRSQLLVSALMRGLVLTLFSVIPAAALISSSLEAPEKAVVIAASLFSLRIFEVAAEGTFFKPQVAGPWQVPLVGRDNVGMSEEKLGEKIAAEKMIRASVGAFSSYFIPKPRPSSEEGRPGLQPVSALDIFSEEELGPSLIPSEEYPSDHIALASDLQLLW